jgi:solute:Na+ symporter, SSS family
MYMKILGLVMGGLAGLFILGIFTRRAHGVGALIGAIGSAVLLWLVQTYSPIHFFLYATIGISSCFIIGYLISLALPVGRKSVQGLTIYTLQKKREDAS